MIEFSLANCWRALPLSSCITLFNRDGHRKSAMKVKRDWPLSTLGVKPTATPLLQQVDNWMARVLRLNEKEFTDYNCYTFL